MNAELDEYEKRILEQHRRYRELEAENEKFWASSQSVEDGNRLANKVDAYIKAVKHAVEENNR